ncbi:MAG: hypothetical protein JNL19_03500 [Burkholderiales bacterium]|nr:hypothetical protein [Burkholderiales bacterium]
MRNRLFACAGLLCVVAGAPLPAVAASPEGLRSMPGAAVETTKGLATERFLSPAVVAYRIEAQPWNGVPAQDSLKSASSDRAKRAQIGFGRLVSADAQSVPLGALDWQTLADGSKAARIQISAPEAAGVRVAYRITGPGEGYEVRFAGSARDDVYLESVVTTGVGETLWSPMLEGSDATLEFRLKRGFDPGQYSLSVPQLSHLIAVGADIPKVLNIGSSESCNVDVACVASPSAALLNIAKATAKMAFTDSATGGSYLCTGTLINSSSGANYFYTAAHCISTQASASTLNTYWFFDAVACNSTATPPYQLLTGGANLLVTDPTMDVTLLELRSSPPSGAFRAGWNATVVPTGTVVVDVHHPSGDLKKFSQGTMLGYAQGPEAYGSELRFQYQRDSFITVRWTNGTTEGGSSGSGAFTYNATGGYYELRGGLEGGGASCSSPNGIDRFSRMDLVFTKLAPYLAPSSIIPVTTSAQATMVEFYVPIADYYFMTSRESEKSLLDSVMDAKNNPAFYRTGYWFKTDPASSSSTSSISRYMIPGAARAGTRSSHFYTALNADKAAITGTGKERFAANCAGVPNGYFCNEGIDSYISMPIGTGSAATCASGLLPVYRVFRTATDDANHRYLTNGTMYSYMVNDQGWAGESIAFCARP